MKILVTGAGGFVGEQIVSELERIGYDVFQIAGSGRGGTKGNSENIKNDKVFYLDIGVAENFRRIEKIGRIDAVVHSAGLAHQFKNIDRELFESANVAGTKNAAQLAAKLKARQFILVGSTAVYGIRSGEKITETSDCRPETIYAESKLAAEKIARRICETHNIALTILRLAPVLGENNAGNAARLVEAIDSRRFLWIGAGENLKTFVYKRDVARACAAILPKKKNGTEIFNVAAEPIKMADFVALTAKILDRSIPSVKIPAKLLNTVFSFNAKFFNIKKINTFAETIEKWLSSDVYSAEKIAAAYNFKAETAIETALVKQIGAYKMKKHYR